MITIQRSLTVEVIPYASRRRLLSKIDHVCNDALNELPVSYQDPYKISVELVSMGELSHFNEASGKALRYGSSRRFLKLVELLFLNLSDEAIRYLYPVFTDKHVLEYLSFGSMFEEEHTENKWSLASVEKYRGAVVGRDAVFATTPLSAVDRGVYGNMLDMRASPTIFSSNLRLMA